MNYGDSHVIFCSLKKLVLLTKDAQAVKKVQGGSSTTFFADLNLDLGCQKKITRSGNTGLYFTTLVLFVAISNLKQWTKIISEGALFS